MCLCVCGCVSGFDIFRYIDRAHRNTSIERTDAFMFVLTHTRAHRDARTQTHATRTHPTHARVTHTRTRSYTRTLGRRACTNSKTRSIPGRSSIDFTVLLGRGPYCSHEDSIRKISISPTLFTRELLRTYIPFFSYFFLFISFHFTSLRFVLIFFYISSLFLSYLSLSLFFS